MKRIETMWKATAADESKKRGARLNCISHVSSSIPYKRITNERVKLPKRSDKGRYNDAAILRRMKFAKHRY